MTAEWQVDVSNLLELYTLLCFWGAEYTLFTTRNPQWPGVYRDCVEDYKAFGGNPLCWYAACDIIEEAGVKTGMRELLSRYYMPIPLPQEK